MLQTQRTKRSSHKYPHPYICHGMRWLKKSDLATVAEFTRLGVPHPWKTPVALVRKKMPENKPMLYFLIFWGTFLPVNFVQPYAIEVRHSTRQSSVSWGKTIHGSQRNIKLKMYRKCNKNSTCKLQQQPCAGRRNTRRWQEAWRSPRLPRLGDPHSSKAPWRESDYLHILFLYAPTLICNFLIEGRFINIWC